LIMLYYPIIGTAVLDPLESDAHLRAYLSRCCDCYVQQG
jgi:hypothetical protein